MLSFLVVCLLGIVVAVVGIVVSVVSVALVGFVGSVLMVVVLAIVMVVKVVVVLVVAVVVVVGPVVGESVVDAKFRSSLMFRSVNRKYPNMPRPRSVKRERTTELDLNLQLLCFLGDTCPSSDGLTG